MQSYDLIVMGTGGVGAAALNQAAARGVSVLGLDRFSPGHDRGSSHGQTRIIRRAYFEHSDYVPLVQRAYTLWDELQRRHGRPLLVTTGLLQVGPAGGAVLSGVAASAAKHGLDIERLTPAEIERRWAGFCIPSDLEGVYEPGAGYLLVEECVKANLADAVRRGAELKTDQTVVSWSAEGTGVAVQTRTDTFHAGALILTPGAWAPELAPELKLRLVVRRKPLYWYPTTSDAYRRENGCPAFLFETPEGVFYGFPQIDERGLKVARHSGGEVVDDPLAVDRGEDRRDRSLVETFLRERLPRVAPPPAEQCVCMYTLSADEHFIVDQHPHAPQVAFAVGLSGHGFKFAPALGQALVELVLDGRTDLPIGFLNCRRAGLTT